MSFDYDIEVFDLDSEHIYNSVSDVIQRKKIKLIVCGALKIIINISPKLFSFSIYWLFGCEGRLAILTNDDLYVTRSGNAFYGEISCWQIGSLETNLVGNFTEHNVLWLEPIRTYLYILIMFIVWKGETDDCSRWIATCSGPFTTLWLKLHALPHLIESIISPGTL